MRLALLYARPGFLLRRAHQLSASIFETACTNATGLTPAQLSVLTVLDACPGLDQATLAKAIGIDKVTTSHLVRGLESRNLLKRPAAENRRRNVPLHLTADGRALLDLADPCLDGAYEQLMSALSPVQQTELLALLGKLNTRLEHHARTPFHPMRP